MASIFKFINSKFWRNFKVRIERCHHSHIYIEIYDFHKSSKVNFIVIFFLFLATFSSTAGDKNQLTANNFTGTIEVTHEEDFNNGYEKTRYYIVDKAKGLEKEILLKNKKDIHLLNPGTKVRMKGKINGRTLQEAEVLSAEESRPLLALDADGSNATFEQPPLYRTYGGRKVLMVLINFPDLNTQPYSKSLVYDYISNTVNNFYKEASYGNTWIESTEVWDWYTMPTPVEGKSCYTIQNEVTQYALDKMKSLNMDTQSYSHISIVFPTGAPSSCSSGGGLAYVGGRLSYLMGKSGLYTAPHEFGHNFGLMHAASLDCKDTTINSDQSQCLVYGYGNYFSTMGRLTKGHFNAYYKELLGWLNYNGNPPIEEVTEYGTFEFELSPMASNDGGLKAIKVYKGINALQTGNLYYYIEHRRAIGQDSHFGNYPSYIDLERTESGALIQVSGKLFTNNGNTSFLLDMTPSSNSSIGTQDERDAALGIGETYSDASAGLTISVLSADNGKLRIRVTREPTGEIDIYAPKNPSITSTPYPAKCGTISLTWTKPQDIGFSGIRGYNLYDGNGNLITFTTENSYQFTAPTEGAYTFKLSAIDNAGNESVGGISTFYSYCDNTPPSTPVIEYFRTLSCSDIELKASSTDESGIWKLEIFDANTNELVDWNLSYISNGGSYTVRRYKDLQGDTTYSVNVIATDKAGNISLKSPTASVTTPTCEDSGGGEDPPTDTTPPTVSLTSPSQGSTVSETIQITATANDDVGLQKVDFYANGKFLGSDMTAPYNFTLNTNNYADGTLALSLKATDTSGNSSGFAQVNVIVKNADTTVPTVTITSPSTGETVSGTINVSASASDNISVSRVDFYVDGNFWVSDNSNPYSVGLDTNLLTDGSHSISARSVDSSGNLSSLASINVTVKNADTIAPTVKITSPANGAIISTKSTYTIQATASDNKAIQRVDFYINNTLQCRDTTEVYNCTWTVPPGKVQSFTIKAIAIDTSGNSTQHQITVSTGSDNDSGSTKGGGGKGNKK